MQRTSTRLVAQRRPRVGIALLLVLGTVAAATIVVYPLKHAAPVVSLGVVYLLGVLLVSTYVGLIAGLLTALLSATAFNFFHLPPLHHFTLANSDNWVALAAFVIVASMASRVADVARSRAQEAEQQRREADLAADLARVLLGAEDRAASLDEAGRLIAAAVGADSAAIEVPARPVAAGRGAIAIPLADEGRAIGRIVVRDRLADEAEERLRQRVAPAVETLVAVALQRDALQAETVETAALRRSEELKTALLRMVSHDLRSPLTAIVTAGHAVQSDTVDAEDRRQLGRAVVEEGERLSRMVANLLDLSRLESGAATPRRVELAIEEVIEMAVERVRDHVELRLARDLPLIDADPAQLERAFENVIENAVKHAGERMVQVRAAGVRDRVVVRVVDQGRGIPAAERERIFEAFERGSDAADRSGTGLGLAIAKGFVEANGGRITVESVPGQGTSFVVAFPAHQHARATA
ncbi:MAG TPA: ATP-binding protein [Solirubrobacteraceae bacterium]|nr:ATP-binding protein [Solirubrobacteraceae bacterium]